MDEAVDHQEWKEALFAWLELSKTTDATFNEFTDLAERLKMYENAFQFLHGAIKSACACCCKR